jgi:cation diffusion facilitator family transporter
MIHAQKTIAAGLLVLGINIVLAAVKIAVGWAGHSYALVADGIESTGDILSSFVTWAGFQLSLRPADENHPYGHGKYETLAGLFSGTVLLAAAGVIAWFSIQEIRTPHHAPAWFTLPVLLGVVLVKWALSRKIRSLGASLDSRALEGDATHHFSDALTSAAAAIGISIALVGGKGYESADDWGALAACLVIVWNGLSISRASLHEILDGDVSSGAYRDVRRLAAEVPGVRGLEKCRLRKSGIQLFVELHVLVDPAMTVEKAHLLGHEVKTHLMRRLPSIQDVVVHLEPYHPAR